MELVALIPLRYPLEAIFSYWQLGVWIWHLAIARVDASIFGTFVQISRKYLFLPAQFCANFSVANIQMSLFCSVHGLHNHRSCNHAGAGDSEVSTI